MFQAGWAAGRRRGARRARSDPQPVRWELPLQAKAIVSARALAPVGGAGWAAVQASAAADLAAAQPSLGAGGREHTDAE